MVQCCLHLTSLLFVTKLILRKNPGNHRLIIRNIFFRDPHGLPKKLFQNIRRMKIKANPYTYKPL